MDDLDGQPRFKTVLEDIPGTEKQQTSIKGIMREVVETAILTLVIFLVVRLAFQNFRIEGNSMKPNLYHGQFLIVNKLVYYLHPPERGDIIVFHSPENPRKDFIKRVVGLPGEEVDVREGRIFINGVRLEESYVTQIGNRSWGPEVVGGFEYFVLGDNRTNSSDSRNWGMLDGDAIIGKAMISYWPPQHWGIAPHYSFAAVE